MQIANCPPSTADGPDHVDSDNFQFAIFNLQFPMAGTSTKNCRCASNGLRRRLQRRRYFAWIESAKREETKLRRLKEAIRLLASGQVLGLK
jgi:hypothetical protein